MANSQRHLYEFGPFELSVTECVMRHRGEVRPLTLKSLELLIVLVQSGGRVLTHQALREMVWVGVKVEKSNLSTQIALLRKVLGDGYIETVPKRGYRFAAEVTERWEGEAAPAMEAGPEPEGLNSSLDAPDSAEVPAGSGRTTRQGYVRKVLMAAGIVGVAALGLVFAYRAHHTKPAARIYKTGRLFARATSEGGATREVKLDRQPQELLVTPDGKQIYSLDQTSNTMTVLDGSSFRVKKVIHLPSALRCATMTRDGKRIYAGSNVDGLMEVDVEHDRVLERVFPTGGPVHSVAVTPDGKKLFAAMGSIGLKVIYTGSGESRLLSAIACPVYAAIDPEGRKLYVSYQCKGPGGRRGHDAVEVYDVDSERAIATVSGPPLVGGVLSFAPNNAWVLLYGADACWNPTYDHAGCPSVPSIVYYLLRTTDRKVVGTFGIPELSGAGVFTPDGGTIVLGGDALSAVDPVKETVSERFARPGEFYRKTAFMPAGDRAIVAIEPAGILVLDRLDAGCLPPAQGLYNLYSGDGTLDDEQQVDSLRAEGGVGFAPGLIGQAFHFNGEDALLRVRSEGACGSCGPSWSASLYIKFGALQGEMSILDRLREDNDPEIQLRKSSEQRIVLEVSDRGQSGQAVSTSEPINAGTWHHLAVVTDQGEHRLYVDGSMIGRVQTPPLSPNPQRGFPGAAYIGAAHDRTRFLNGLVDEVAFYNRALSAAEIKGMYELSVHRPCVLARAN